MKAPFKSPPLRIPLTITSPFGIRTDPVTGEQHVSHNGCDLHAPDLTEVLAIDAGVVASAYQNDEGGMQMLIDLDSGWRVGYAHLSTFLVEVGDRVEVGEEVALSGHTGAHLTGPHLHLTLRPPKASATVDPAPFLGSGGAGGGGLVALAVIAGLAKAFL